MKLIDPVYEIVQMPDGEEALRIIEYFGRIAYKSEDKIDDGWDWCERCDGQGFIDVKKGVDEVTEDCPACGGKKGAQVREPSSHKFVRMILQAERKAKMIMMAKKAMDTHMEENFQLKWDQLSEELINNIIDYMRQHPAHESVIEHCSASVKFTSNRGFTHELVRHRLASFTQESTRYCDYNKGKFGSEISVIERTFWGKVEDYEKLSHIVQVWKTAMKNAEDSYQILREMDVPPEIARDVLPQALKADIGMSANFREWQHVFALRDSPRAHPDMRQLMAPLHEEFRKRIPIIFDEV